MIEILQREKGITPMDVVAKWLRFGSMCVFPAFQRVTAPGCGRRTSPIRVVWVVGVAFSGVRSASAQQPEDLQQQLQQLKQQYDATTHDLTQRIAALEEQIQKQKEKEKQEGEAIEKAKQGAVSVAELAAEQAAQQAVTGQSDQVGAKYQGQLPSEPTYDFLRDAEA